MKQLLSVSAISALLLLCGASLASAQPAMSAGVKAGANRATMTVPSEELEAGVEIKSLLGVVGGVWVQRDSESGLMLRLEGLFSQKGMTPSVRLTEFGDVLEAKTKVRLTYVDVPVLIGWQSPGTDGPRFSVFAGPTVSVKLSSSFSVDSVELNGQDITREFGGEIEDELNEFDLDDSLSSTDVGLTAGVGAAIGKIIVDARYTLGLTDVSKRADSAKTKNRAISVMFGFRFN